MPWAPVVGGGSLNPVEFRQKITTNVEQVISRINGIAPQFITEEVNKYLYHLFSLFNFIIHLCISTYLNIIFTCLILNLGGKFSGSTAVCAKRGN